MLHGFTPMNDENGGTSLTKGHKWDFGKYKVARLHDGKNSLTGSTDKEDFTCTEIEVFALE